MAFLALKGGKAAVESGSDFPGAPLSVSAPVAGTSRMVQWNLQKTGAAGPRAFTNGTWNTTYAEAATGSGVSGAAPNDPYLAALGFKYNNFGDLWLNFPSIDPGGTRTVAHYDFDGAPDLIAWGDLASVVITDCANYNITMGRDINRNSALGGHTMALQITYCDMDETRWDMMCACTFELGPYNFIRRQLQELGYGGGVALDYFIGINCHHNLMTGGGVYGAGSGSDWSHIEWWQQIVPLANPSNGSYSYCTDNMIDFTKDGQATTMSLAAWTALISAGGTGVRLKFSRNIVKGLDIVAAHPANPNRMGPIMGYDDAAVTAGFEFEDNAMSCSPSAPGGYTYKHGGGSLKPATVNNRTFRDADSDTWAWAVPGPADNILIVAADLG